MSRKPPSNVVRYRTAQWCGCWAKGQRDGRVTEQGRHADLMAFGGRYAELYKLQASQYDTVQ